MRFLAQQQIALLGGRDQLAAGTARNQMDDLETTRFQVGEQTWKHGHGPLMDVVHKDYAGPL